MGAGWVGDQTNLFEEKVRATDYRRWQQKLLCSGLAWLRPTVSKVENKNPSGKLTRRLYEFQARGINCLS